MHRARRRCGGARSAGRQRGDVPIFRRPTRRVPSPSCRHGLAIMAGCGGELPDLKAKARSATPTGSQPPGDCAGAERFIESAWLKCIVVVRGTRRSAIADVAKRLFEHGFRMGCEDAVGGLEVVAVRGRTRIIVSARRGSITFDESDDGKPLDVVDSRFAPPGSRRIPAGFVGVKISADKPLPSSPRYLPNGACTSCPSPAHE